MASHNDVPKGYDDRQLIDHSDRVEQSSLYSGYPVNQTDEVRMPEPFYVQDTILYMTTTTTFAL